MEIEEALTSYLLGFPELAALIDDKLYPDELPQGIKLPAVLYSKISDVKDHTLVGQNRLESPMLQFTAFAGTKPAARAIANQLKAALCDFQGMMSGIEVQYIRLENELSSLERTPDGTLKIYTEILEFEINYLKE
ncbi:tail completion protein gp17 [Gudongella oleilytica]|uniref:tail completion protein gp17 n=1 Tax=Gudongella oleilytica TaxID=1582259 RepID=UPI000FF8A15C|nr:DUF3168 domain-containing protein [Gudongella oleilytica]